MATKQLTESSAERFLQSISAIVDAKLAEKQQAYAQKAVSATGLYNNYGHGPGLFTPVMDPNVINAMQLPLAGLQAILPEMPTDLEIPVYGIITGQTAGTTTSTVPDECSPWGTAGFTKLCRQIATLGEQGVSSNPISLNRVGRFVDRADFRDYRLVGDPFSNAYDGNMVQGFPGAGGAGSSDFLNNEVAKVMREVEVETIRRFAPDIWTANPTNAGDNYHRAYYRGLQLLVNTGYQDAVIGSNGGSAVLCPKADSTIINFASVAGQFGTNSNISTAPGAGNALVQTIADLVYVFQRQSVEEGLDPVEWVFVGTPELFREITAVWPCAYLTNRCMTASAATPAVVEASQQVAMREEMRSGSFLWVDGKQIRFIQDTTLVQTQGTGAAVAGTFTSDLYYLPLTVRGGFPVLFKTYFNYNAPGAAADAIRAFGPMFYGSQVSPNGKYLYSLDKTHNCVIVNVTYRPGLVLRTPFLAARVTNIVYQPRLVTPSWNPSAPSYYVNGGVTTGTGPSYWKPTVNG